MASPRIPLPRRGVPPRHLFRHLLREASYLPPICRPYIALRIKTQFRDHRNETKLAQKRVVSGLQQLRRLQAANSGSIKHLHLVFLRTFGRTGEIRRLLMAPLVLPDPPASSDAAEAPKANKPMSGGKMMAAYNRARQDTRYNRNFLDRWDFAKLQEFLQSQMRHATGTSPAVWPRVPPHKLNPTATLSEKNIWGRPLPLRELRTRLKKWWLVNIPKIVPPLGMGEWETLRSLATDKEFAVLLKMPPRRPVAAPVHEESKTGVPWSWQAYAVVPASRMERERQAGLSQSTHGLDYDPVPGAASGAVTPRKLRRLAGKVFEASSYAKRDGSTGRTRYVWGRLAPDLPVVSGEQSFFANLDETGSSKRAQTKRQHTKR